MEQQRQHKQERNWEQMGTASGVLAALLFVLRIVMAVSAASEGISAADVGSAQTAPLLPRSRPNHESASSSLGAIWLLP